MIGEGKWESECNTCWTRMEVDESSMRRESKKGRVSDEVMKWRERRKRRRKRKG